MAKVYIDRDDFMSFFLWDEEVFNALGYKMSPLVEVPDELVLEYNQVRNTYGKMQEKLRKYYESQ